jgi:alpha-beta hydrolase superfamily lysophospholipase
MPCVLTITGSGAEERDEALPMVRGYRPFRQIADTLARRGIAVLRLDDRGTGASGGRFAGSSSEDFANDVEDALRWLRTVNGIDSTRLALLGHSEGGIVAPLVAARGVSLKGMVLLAGTSWTGRRVMEYQNRMAARKAYSGAALDSVMRVSMHAVDSLAAADAWLGFFARHDPLAVARTLKSPPVLVLQGATDRQVTAEQATELAGAFKAAGNRDVTLRVLPATNHLFLPDTNGDPAGYPALAVHAIPSATLGIIADWLVARLRP